MVIWKKKRRSIANFARTMIARRRKLFLLPLSTKRLLASVQMTTESLKWADAKTPKKKSAENPKSLKVSILAIVAVKTTTKMTTTMTKMTKMTTTMMKMIAMKCANFQSAVPNSRRNAKSIVAQLQKCPKTLSRKSLNMRRKLLNILITQKLRSAWKKQRRNFMNSSA